MASIEGVGELIDKLKKLQFDIASDGKNKVTIGYTAAYALYVHENLEMKLKGQPRDPRLRANKSGRRVNPPRNRQVNPQGLYWDPHGIGQSKFIETPMRQHQGNMAKIVENAMRAGSTLLKALILAGMFLLRESQKLVPVDTGNLKASGFIRVNDSIPTKAQSQ